MAWRKLNSSRVSTEAERIETWLAANLIGQPEAIDVIVEMYQVWRSGLSDPNRPICSVLMMGQTGCGKTKTVETFVEALFGSRKNYLKIDCAEFAHSHEIARLIGSPPGYLGHRDTPPFLAQANIDKYKTKEHPIVVLLLDEIEKANDALWQLLLGILDKGSLTTGSNEQVDMRDCMIFMTSNVGADQFEKIYNNKVGFKTGAEDPVSLETLKENILEDCRRVFSPEFIGRLDKQIVFNTLTEDDYRRIVDLEIDVIRGRLAGLNVTLSVEDTVKDYLLKNGTNKRYGARPLRRLIEKQILVPIAKMIGAKEIRPKDTVKVEIIEDGTIQFRAKGKAAKATAP